MNWVLTPTKTTTRKCCNILQHPSGMYHLSCCLVGNPPSPTSLKGAPWLSVLDPWQAWAFSGASGSQRDLRLPCHWWRRRPLSWQELTSWQACKATYYCVKPFTISSCSVNSASDSCHILGRSPWFLFNEFISSSARPTYRPDTATNHSALEQNSQAFGQREVSIYRAIQSSDVLKCLQLQSSEPAMCKKETWSGLFFPCLDLEAQQEVWRIQANPLKKRSI